MNKPSQDNIELKIKDLEEENELLLLQLHQVQEELESYFLKCRGLESGKSNGNHFAATQFHSSNQGNGQNITISWVDDELPEVLAEKSRLTTLSEVQQWIYQTESQNGLNARLAKLLAESINTTTGLISVPSKLIGFWRSATNKTPPSSLGSKDYEKLISVFKEGGLQSAEALISSNNLSFTVTANAYTALARHLMKKDVKSCAKLAHSAYETDPRPYRLKWLACRLHEAGEVQKAEAMIDLLPQNMNFSESEGRQVDQIRYEAKRQREKQAKDLSEFSKKKQQIQEQLTQLTNAKDTQAQLASERANQIEELKRTQVNLQEQLTQLTNAKDTQAQLASERANQIEELKRTQVNLQEQLTQLTNAKDTQAQLASERANQIEELKRTQVNLQEQLTQLTNAKDTQAQLASERANQIEELKRTQVNLQEQLTQLTNAKDTQAQLASERANQIEELKRTQVNLQEQLTQLTNAKDTQAQLASERANQIEELKRTQVNLQEQLTQLTNAKDTQAQLASERANQIEELKRTQVNLQEQLTQLTNAKDTQAQLASERANQIEELKRTQVNLQEQLTQLTNAKDTQAQLASERANQIATLKNANLKYSIENERLGSNQKIMQSEITKAETQIDLVKELILREPLNG